MSTEGRRQRGYSNWRQGLDAEIRVEGAYRRKGSQALARRWRGSGGEIDLILQDGPTIVFVEVKRSRSFEDAALRLGPHQVTRLVQTAEEYLECEPHGTLSNCRFDVALVDEAGRCRVIENALAA